MPRWFWFVPFGFFVAFLGFHALKLGIQRANITETDVINHYAAQYLDDVQRVEGVAGSLADCLAVPAAAPVWIEVRCTPGNGAPAFLYGAKRDGRLIYAARDGASPET